MTDHVIVSDTITVRSSNGVRFLARVIRDGDRYGLDDCLTVGEGTSLRIEGPGPKVEFYDTRYPHTRFGQFVSRYGLDTILEHTGGLNLDGGIDDWSIDANAMTIVRIWLNHITEGELS